MDVELDIDAALASFKDATEQMLGQKPVRLRITRYAFAAAPKREPQQIAILRKKFNLSQEAFASVLNVPRITLASWETGRKKPSGAALRLLQVVELAPETVLENVQRIYRPRRKRITKTRSILLPPKV